MNILAFDTAGEFLSTGLKTSKGFFEENRTSGLRHSEHLLPTVERLMTHAELTFKELDLIVCSKGPGSFTGLRIGMSTAKGISTGCNCPVISINNLDVYAYGYGFFDGAVVPLIDARKKRYYSAVYFNGHPETEYLDATTEDLIRMLGKYKRVLFTGPACSLFKTAVSELIPTFPFNPFFYRTDSGISPVLIELGMKRFETDGADADNSGPYYIRLSDAELSKL